MRGVATVLVVVGLALPAGLARAADAPAPAPAPAPATSRPGALVVALGLQSPLLQAGVVRGRDVILARGFEVELARTLARRLGGRVSRFVYVPSQARLLASSGGGWQLALGGIDPSRGARAGADLSVPYLTTDSPSSRAAASSGLDGSPTCARRCSAPSAAATAPARCPSSAPGSSPFS